MVAMFVRPHLTDAPSLTVLSPEDGGEGAGGGAGGHLAPPVGADVDALRSKLAAFEKAAADRAAEDDKRAAAELERAKKAGDVEKMSAELESLKAKLAELEPDAKYGRETRAQQKERIEAAKKALPEADQSLLDSALATGDLRLADSILSRISAPAGKTTARANAVGGPPPPADAPDFDRLANEDPKGFRTAVQKYPREWSAHKEKLRGPQTRQPTLNERSAERLQLIESAKKAG